MVQALYGSLKTAEKMHYCERAMTDILKYAWAHGWKLREYNNTTCSCDYLGAVKTRKIKPQNVIIQLSLDGAQLYPDKDSDCWIFIYIIHNLPPKLRYQKRLVFLTGFILGPEKMKDCDSFLYPGAIPYLSTSNRGPADLGHFHIDSYILLDALCFYNCW